MKSPPSRPKRLPLTYLHIRPSTYQDLTSVLCMDQDERLLRDFIVNFKHVLHMQVVEGCYHNYEY